MSGKKQRKEIMVFLGSKFEDMNELDDKYNGYELDQKIIDGRNWHIVFEKDNENYKTCFHWATGDDGKITLLRNNAFQVKTEVLSTTIYTNKQQVLEIIKTDPALAGKF